MESIFCTCSISVSLIHFMNHCPLLSFLTSMNFSPSSLPLTTSLFGTAAERTLWDWISSHISENSQLRANFQWIIIGVIKAESVMARVSETLLWMLSYCCRGVSVLPGKSVWTLHNCLSSFLCLVLPPL